jgi:hypothetical protein
MGRPAFSWWTAIVQFLQLPTPGRPDLGSELANRRYQEPTRTLNIPLAGSAHIRIP